MHNQQKVQIFHKFKKQIGIFVDYDGCLKLKISPNIAEKIVTKLFEG
jgi:hypothetical protein